MECSVELDDVLDAYLLVAEAVDDPHWAFDVYLLLQVDLEPSTILSKVLLEQSVTSTGIFVNKKLYSESVNTQLVFQHVRAPGLESVA